MNTPSPSSFSPAEQHSFPWTGLSVTVAVCWMLSLSFDLQPPLSEAPEEEEAAQVEELSEALPLANLYSSTLESWSLKSERLTSSTLGSE